MKTYTIGKKVYYSGSDILKNKEYTKGIYAPRQIIHKKDLKGGQYCYAKKDGDEWVKTEGHSKTYDKVFILKSFYDKAKNEIKEEAKAEKQKQMVDINDCALLPDPVELKCTNKKMLNMEKIINGIDTRGELNYEGIYFSISDIAIKFKLGRLNTTISQVNSNYFLNDDYVYFNANGSKRIYFTYYGLIHYAFNSKEPKLKKISKWITHTIYSLSFGSTVDIAKLVKTFKTGTPVPIAKKLVNGIPCIYLIFLGYAKDLRKSFNIGPEYDDNDPVYKIGFSKDLSDRLGKHETDFGKVGCNIKLKKYVLINETYMSAAETDLKKYTKQFRFDCKLDFEDKKEIIIVPKKKLVELEKQYDSIHTKYSGCIDTLTNTHNNIVLKQLKDISDLKYQLKNKEDQLKYELTIKDQAQRIHDLENQNIISAQNEEIKKLNRIIKKMQSCQTDDNESDSDDELDDIVVKKPCKRPLYKYSGSKTARPNKASSKTLSK